MKIENYNLVIPFYNDDESLSTAFIPQPNKILFDTIAGLLGYFYTKIRTGNLLPEVFVTDWEAIANEIIEANNLNENYKSKLGNFLDKLLISSQIVDDKGNYQSFNDIKLDDESINIIKGYSLFICALLRYTPPQIRMNALGQLITLQSVAEYSMSLKKPSTEQPMEKNTNTKKTKIEKVIQ